MRSDVRTPVKIGTVIALLLLAASLSWAGTWDLNPDKTVIKHKHESQTDVTGEGYVMVYQKVDTSNLSLDEYMHGSGSFDFADLTNSEQKTSGTTDYYWVIDSTLGSKTYGQWVKKWGGPPSVISFTKQNEATQAPTSFSYGPGWYSSHPVSFNSYLKDKTVAKSYQEGAMMDHQLEYARGYKGDIAVDLNCTGAKYNADGRGLTQMRVEDDVTQGTVHIGELLTDLPIKAGGAAKDQKKFGWKEPIIEVDENYIGNFHVQKNMKIDVVKSKSTSLEDWLPCCSGGFDQYQKYMDYNYAYKETGLQAGIFDCTCRNTSISTFMPKWNASLAQFPTEKYMYKP